MSCFDGLSATAFSRSSPLSSSFRTQHEKSPVHAGARGLETIAGERIDQYMSSSISSPGMPAADFFFFSGLSLIIASVVSISPATEAAF